MRNTQADDFPACRSFIDPEILDVALNSKAAASPEVLFQLIADQSEPSHAPFLSDLIRLEWAVAETERAEGEIRAEGGVTSVNPTVQLLPLSWRNLAALLPGGSSIQPPSSERGDEIVVVWKDPGTGTTRAQAASNDILLALKVVIEELDPREVASRGGLPVAAVNSAIDRAVSSGILLAPESLIRRDPAVIDMYPKVGDEFLVCRTFTLQWHITQACDLHCKHCYDRSSRAAMPFDRAISLLDDLSFFCWRKGVKGAVSLSGGNPFLYPRFRELYREAVERGFSVSILGNPAAREEIEGLLEIEPPTHIQISLEGLRERNDHVRGRGHFDRSLAFLEILKELGVFSMVMLTLTRDNIGDVLPLAELLRNKADLFFFNRLSMVGEGANLRPPGRAEYAAFLKEYTMAAEMNPVLGLKDNLLNIVRHERGMDLFGGCTGFGCGAAFNFLAVLADGEAHACRKFPSSLGNVFAQSLSEIYDSREARRYREGCSACRSCPIRAACGGCLAVSYSHGLDFTEQTDPHCFFGQSR